MNKQEIVFELSHGNWYLSLLVTILALIILWGLVKLSIYLTRNSKSKKRDKYAAIVWGIMLTIPIIIIGIVGTTLYDFQVQYNIVNVNVEEIVQYDDYNAGRRLISKDSDKYELLATDEALGDYIEETFVGQTCEIEYYIVGRIMKRITIIE